MHTIDGFTFVWFTDGIGCKSAKGNLREIFEVMDTIYSIDDMGNEIMDSVFVNNISKCVEGIAYKRRCWIWKIKWYIHISMK